MVYSGGYEIVKKAFSLTKGKTCKAVRAGQNFEKMEENIIEKFTDKDKRKWLTFESICLCLLGIIATVICSELPKTINKIVSEKNDVVMLGSGTVMRFLKERYPTFSNDRNVHFFDGPSLTAVEVLINGKEKKESSIQLIAMSSSEIIEDSLKNIGWEPSENRLYEIYLGDDELNVVLYPPDNKTAKKYNYERRDLMTLEELYSILKNDTLEYDLYLTTEKSGTRSEFKKYLDELGQFNWKPNSKTYSLSDDVLKEIENSTKLTIILCSHCYKHKHKDFKGFPIVYKDAIIKRGLYLYFIAPKNDLVVENEDSRVYSLLKENNFSKIIKAMGIENEFIMQKGCNKKYNKIYKLRPAKL